VSTADATLDVRTPASFATGEFLQRVAHDLRGPVGVVVGALDELELELGPDSERVRAYLLMARRGAERVLRTAEQVHRASQLERGEVEWLMTPVDLRGLVRSAALDSEAAESRQGILLEVAVGEVECTVAADADWLRATIVEIIGSSIRFASSKVCVRISMQEEHVRLDVTDDGPGSDKPGGHRFAAADTGGIGLSLPLVREVLAAHQGHLDIDDGAPEGSSACTGGHVVMVLPRLRRAPK